MRKFYTLLTAMALTAVAANAQGTLGQANLLDSEDWYYPVTGNIYTTYEFQWEADGQPVEITLVEGKVITVTIGSESEEFTPELLGSNPNGGVPDPMTRAEADAEPEDAPAATILSLNINEWYYDELDGPSLGKVTISIPEGIVEDGDGNTNAAQEITYNAYPQTYFWEVECSVEDWSTINPAKAKNITWTFEDDVTVLEKHAPILFITYEGGYDGKEAPFTGTVTADGEVLTLGVGELADGEYMIQIPTAVVMVGDNQVNGTLDVRFTVFDGMSEAEILNGPARYEAQGLLPSLQLTWDYQTIVPTEKGLTGSIIIADGEIDENGYPEEREIEIPADNFFLATMEKPSDEPGVPNIPLPDFSTRAEESGNTLIVDYQELIPADYVGQIIINIPAGIVTSTEGINPGLEVYVTIYPLMTQSPTVVVEDGLIDVSWEGYMISSPSESLILIDPAGERTDLMYTFDPEWFPGQVYVNDNEVLEIDLTGMDLEDGEYTIVIPSVSIQIYDEEDNYYLCGEIYLEVTIENGEVTEASSGIESIGSSIKAEVKGVYNLQGVKMSNDLNKLPRGLYIIDGKKVLVK
ncbi:MAG: hypothetical protein J1D77_06415 [Muribaculaceae bacterium]|nr:hypothetical protein [Muribaculaceae bacterium]